MTDNVIITVIGGMSILSLVSSVINTIVTNSVKRSSEQHNILWDAHNEKKGDSENLKKLSAKLTDHESKFLEFTFKQDARNNKIDSKLEQIEIAVKHKDNNQQTLVTGIFDMLTKIREEK